MTTMDQGNGLIRSLDGIYFKPNLLQLRGHEKNNGSL